MIYTVFGESGVYYGRENWPIASFFDVEKVKELVTSATKRAEEIKIARNDQEHTFNGRGLTNEFDNEMYMDNFTGRVCFYETTQILDS